MGTWGKQKKEVEKDQRRKYVDPHGTDLLRYLLWVCLFGWYDGVTDVGESDFDDLLTEREKINIKLQTILDKNTDPWGIKVINVEVKHVDITEDLRRAMARQAEAERERRAKIIAAEGEHEAAEKICKAAEMMQEYPIALQLRYLQTLVEIGGENNTTNNITGLSLAGKDSKICDRVASILKKHLLFTHTRALQIMVGAQ